MAYIYFTKSEHHSKPGHFENARRIEIPEREIKQTFDFTHFPYVPILHFNEFRNLLYFDDMFLEFTRPDIITCKFCKKKYSGFVCNCGESECFWGSDTYYTNLSLMCIIELVSNLKGAVDAIFYRVKYHYLLVRPPGHHCYNKGSGFCLVNNVFLTAKYAKNRGINKIFILDWDFHHGDGTAKLVNGESGMFFVSIHGYGRNIFPGTGSIEENTDNVRNFPLLINSKKDRKKYGDQEYMNLINGEIHQLIVDFSPELIIISNGLDSHKDDLLEGMNLTNQFYINATQKLITYNVPLIFILEGGYNPEVIKNVSIDIINQLE